MLTLELFVIRVYHSMGFVHGASGIIRYKRYDIKVKIMLEESLRTNKISFIASSGNVSGRIKIVVGNGLKVWHTGLILNVEQYLHYLDPFVSSDLCAREMKIVVDPVDSSGERVMHQNPLL